MRRRIHVLLVLLVAAVTLTPAPPAFASSTFSGYYTNSYGTAMPMVVALHGCTQTTGDFAAGTRWNALAETKGFIVLYVQQSYYLNSALCWKTIPLPPPGRAVSWSASR